MKKKTKKPTRGEMIAAAIKGDTPKWNDVAERLRRAMGLCPPTPNEADQAIANADEVPMSEDEVRDIVSEVTKGSHERHARVKAGRAAQYTMRLVETIRKRNQHGVTLQSPIKVESKGAPDAK